MSAPAIRPQSRPAGRRAILAVGLLAAAAGLSGCADRHNIEVGAIPDDYRTRHPIVVTEAMRDLEIFVASSDTKLTLADQSRVDEFASRFRASRASVLRIQVPSGTRNDAAAQLVTDSTLRVLARHGIPRSRVLISPYHPQYAADGPPPLLLSFNSVVAEVEPCGRWPEDLGDTSQNRNYFNFGCASQSNLAAQIADPRDLLGPRGMSEIDAQRRSDVIDKYRRGERTASQSSTTESDYDW